MSTTWSFCVDQIFLIYASSHRIIKKYGFDSFGLIQILGSGKILSPIFINIYDSNKNFLMIPKRKQQRLQLWSLMKSWMFHEIFWSLLKSFTVSWSLMKSDEVSWSLMKSDEVSWSLMKSDEVSWSFLKSLEAFSSLLEPLKVSWDLLKSSEVFWKTWSPLFPFWLIL